MSFWKQFSGKEKPLARKNVAKRDVDKLSKLLTEILSLDELHALCINLSVSFETLPGNSKSAKARELVLYFTRLPYTLDEFIQTCSQMHPDIPWHDPDSIEIQRPNKDKRMLMAQLLNYCFNVNELRALCLDLTINYDNLSGTSKRGKVLDLLGYFSRYPRNLDQVSQACSKLRPQAPWDAHQITRYEPYSRNTLVSLWQALLKYYDDEEAWTLGENLKVNYKYMPRLDQGGTARELVLYLARRERLNELVEVCTKQFPDFPWQETLNLQDIQKNEEDIPEHIEPMRLRQNLSSFSEVNLRDICFEMGIDYDNIAGSNQVGELVSLCERQGRIPELILRSRQTHPNLQW